MASSGTDGAIWMSMNDATNNSKALTMSNVPGFVPDYAGIARADAIQIVVPVRKPKAVRVIKTK